MKKLKVINRKSSEHTLAHVKRLVIINVFSQFLSLQKIIISSIQKNFTSFTQRHVCNVRFNLE
jgi:hypothetical protein